MGRKKLILTEEEILARKKAKKLKQQCAISEEKRQYRDKKSPFYKMTLHDQDYEYLQKRWERYLRNQIIIENFNNAPIEQRNISEYNDACNIVVNCKNLIIDFLNRYSTYQNVQFMKNKFHEIDRKGVPI